MGESVGNCSALLAEIDAFRQGFGHPARLSVALRSATVLIPITEDDRVLISTFGGLDWFCAFTSEQEYARYVLVRDEHAGPCRFHTVFGWRLMDILIPALDRPTGIVIDVAGVVPMAFPPSLDEAA
ncbi:SseB family protein [Rhodococcus tibetensis]|uniref:SseB family protein n=1 Tax=Rhodococcus tibetensis TaxID=2965064 RepID=A0ABT1QCS0_9NOCA|nr:SseB family protein [Rhodococcus sp. FXJ9.536]MCQ4119488.1 SseB family protein [Rhodococcus sp. FXJ9.536]